ncbi:hypothetical protein RFI_34116, partial [Reticulomyxa filosa]
KNKKEEEEEEKEEQNGTLRNVSPLEAKEKKKEKSSVGLPDNVKNPLYITLTHDRKCKDIPHETRVMFVKKLTQMACPLHRRTDPTVLRQWILAMEELVRSHSLVASAYKQMCGQICAKLSSTKNLKDLLQQQQVWD